MKCVFCDKPAVYSQNVMRQIDKEIWNSCISYNSAGIYFDTVYTCLDHVVYNKWEHGNSFLVDKV